MKNKNLIQKFADNEYPIKGNYNTKRYGNDRMNEYVVKTTENAILLSNGLICGFEKPSIETRFCFHDEGPQYEFYKDLMKSKEDLKSYFFFENLKDLDDMIKIFSKETEDVPAYYDYENGNCKATYIGVYYGRNSESYKKLTEEDRLSILNELKEQKNAFIKRLETWWKKYGAEKLHTWTYWADA
jgi:hypothetical protein